VASERRGDTIQAGHVVEARPNSRQRVFEMTITDDVLVAINDAFIEMKGGVS
jgi:hypothetical protein